MTRLMRKLRHLTICKMIAGREFDVWVIHLSDGDGGVRSSSSVLGRSVFLLRCRECSLIYLGR